MSEQRQSIIDQLPDVKIPEELFWEGDFDEYLDRLVKRPEAVFKKTPHQLMWEMINSYGKKEYNYLKEPVIRYDILDDPFTSNHRFAIYGERFDRVFTTLVNAFKGGAQELGQEERIFILLGPVGTGKSTVAGELLVKGLEAYTRTPNAELYAPFWYVDKEDSEGLEILGKAGEYEKNFYRCALHEEPFCIIREDIRPEILKDINERINRSRGPDKQFEIDIAGYACPTCNFLFEAFLKRYKGDWKLLLKTHLKVSRLIFSKKDGIGIVTIRPKAEKDQDEAEFQAIPNYAALGKLGDGTDPRTQSWKGYVPKSNRGYHYIEEFLKFSETFLWIYLGASQEGKIQPKLFSELYIRTVILGSTNEEEWRQKIEETKRLEALGDRIIKIDVPYNLQWSNEVRIYQKKFRSVPGRHLAPHTLEMAAYWAELTRLEPPKKEKLEIQDKLELYDGRFRPQYGEDAVREIMKMHPNEGFRGISPRFVIDKISAASVSEEQTRGCINFFIALKSLESGLVRHQHATSEETRTTYKKYFDLTKEKLNEILQDDIQEVIVGNERALKELFEKFINHIIAYKSAEKIKNPITEEETEVDPNEVIMPVLSQIGYDSIEAAESFIKTLTVGFTKRAMQRQKDRLAAEFDFRSDPELYRALKLRLFELEKDKINWEASLSKMRLDVREEEEADDDLRIISKLKRGLIEKKGYCKICATEIIVHVGSIFSRKKSTKSAKT